jgi:hypothetical protein
MQLSSPRPTVLRGTAKITAVIPLFGTPVRSFPSIVQCLHCPFPSAFQVHLGLQFQFLDLPTPRISRSYPGVFSDPIGATPQDALSSPSSAPEPKNKTHPVCDGPTSAALPESGPRARLPGPAHRTRLCAPPYWIPEERRRRPIVH